MESTFNDHNNDEYDYPPDVIIRAVLRRQLSDVQTTLGPYLHAKVHQMNPARYFETLFSELPYVLGGFAYPWLDWRTGRQDSRHTATGSTNKELTKGADDAYSAMSAWKSILNEDDEPQSLYDLFIDEMAERKQNQFRRFSPWFDTEFDERIPNNVDPNVIEKDPPCSIRITKTQNADGIIETREEMRWADGREYVTVTQDSSK
ncbi:hypothetical protein BDF19DRAFT_411346 [Syncephalis fuscata]|nr:hypothetical protein BDF19DRAFT_411346 [Syncephalis fuscata]